MKLTATSTLALLLLTGCGFSGSSNTVSPSVRGRPATDTPDRFDPPPSYAFIVPADTVPGSGCVNPLTDPRSGTKITLHASSRGIGDYIVPSGMYDVHAGQLLRVDCNTGRAIGIVNR